MMKGEYDDSADYAQPDRWNGNFGGLHGRVPLFRLGIQREKGFAYNHHPKAAEIYNSLADGSATDFPDYYWNTMALEAFRSLIDDDAAAGKKLAAAVITAMKISQAKREADPKRKADLPPDQPVGGFQLAFCYDFLYNWMTPEQRKLVHEELANSTWSHDNYGTFNTAESSRSNWATFSYWLYQVLAIEGEPGFNDLKVRGMYRGWRNLFTYGWFASGATFEGEAKNQLGMDGVLLFAPRAGQYGFEELGGHPYALAYAKSFLPHSVNAMHTGFQKYDLLGGSRGRPMPMDPLGLKYLFPDDKVLDWVYRSAIGESYENVPDRPDGYRNDLLVAAIYSSDFDPANNDPSKLGLGNTFFCGERALMMTRSSWDPEAMQLNMHTRQANGGHPFSDRNAIMVAGAGRIWSPNGYASFKTAENSVVNIDGLDQDLQVPGRAVDFLDGPQATFMVGDAKYAWDWKFKRLEKPRGYYTTDDVKAGRVDVPAGWEPVQQSVNDFAYTKLPYEYLGKPLFEYAHWIKPKGALSPYVRQPNVPVKRAFRTAGLVRGEKPYALVVDDIQVDDNTHRFDWTLALERDIQIASVTRRPDQTMDILLTGSDPDQTAKPSKDPLPERVDGATTIPVNQPMLLVRVLNGNGTNTDPMIVELPNATDQKKYGPVRRLVITSESVSPDFKVLLFPYRNGASTLPETSWNAARDTLTLKIGNQTDVIHFASTDAGKTNVRIDRGGETLADVSKPVPPPLP